MRTHFKWMLMGVFCIAAAAQPLVTEAVHGRVITATPTQPGFKSRNERYRLQPLDIIDVSFRFTSEFNQIVTVQPDGFITLEVAGELKAAGLTLPEVTAAILKKCQGLLHDPVVSVGLVEFSKPYFVVNGQVQRPGKFDLRGDMSVSDAIAVAGGFVSGARDSEVLVFRRVSPDLAEVKKIDLKQILREGKVQEDMMLHPSDSIFVSKSPIGKIERFMSVSKLRM